MYHVPVFSFSQSTLEINLGGLNVIVALHMSHAVQVQAVEVGVLMSRNLSLLVLVLLGLIAVQVPAQASLPHCPENVGMLVKRTQRIVVADVVSLEIKGGVLEYGISVVENIKGTSPSTLVVRFPLATPWPDTERRRRFLAGNRAQDVRSQHSDLDFWLDSLHTAGQGIVHPLTCEAVFELRRGRHLMFLSEPYHAKAFEPIADSNDLWLQTVRAVASDHRVTGRIVDPISFMKMFHSVYLTECFRSSLDGRKPRLLFGREVNREIDLMIRIGGADFCKRRKDRHAIFLALFRDRADNSPIGVAIKDGILHFAERYGDLVLDNREVSLKAALLSLRPK